MYRRLTAGFAVAAVAFSLACSNAASSDSAFAPSPPATPFASGGSGGGGGGSVRPCAILTFGIVNNTVLSSSVAPYWQPNTAYGAQAIGSTEKSCDTVPGAVMIWTDITGTNDGCDATIPRFVGATYAKYGLKPMSRFDQYFVYSTGDNCIGTTRTIKATLIDQTTGAVLSTMTTTWLVG